MTVRRVTAPSRRDHFTVTSQVGVHLLYWCIFLLSFPLFWKRFSFEIHPICTDTFFHFVLHSKKYSKELTVLLRFSMRCRENEFLPSPHVNSVFVKYQGRPNFEISISDGRFEEENSPYPNILLIQTFLKEVGVDSLLKENNKFLW